MLNDALAYGRDVLLAGRRERPHLHQFETEDDEHAHPVFERRRLIVGIECLAEGRIDLLDLGAQRLPVGIVEAPSLFDEGTRPPVRFRLTNKSLFAVAFILAFLSLLLQELEFGLFIGDILP